MKQVYNEKCRGKRRKGTFGINRYDFATNLGIESKLSGQLGSICCAENRKHELATSDVNNTPFEHYVLTHSEASKTVKANHILAYKAASGRAKASLRKVVLCDHLHYIDDTVSYHCGKYKIFKGSAEYKELQAVAAEAFLKAMDGYKIEQDATLETYAKKVLKTAMANEYYNSRLISLPNTIRSGIKTVNKAREKLGESASYKDLVDECGFSKKTGREKLALLDEASLSLWSIDYSAEENDNMSFRDRIEGKTFDEELNENSIEQELCGRELQIKELTNDVLARLEGRDRYLLVWYYGIPLSSFDAYMKLAVDANVAENTVSENYERGVLRKSLSDIGKDFGCTKEACRQRRDKVLSRLAEIDWVVEGCKSVSILR